VIDYEKVIRGWERCEKCNMSPIAPPEGTKAYLDCEYTIGPYCGKDKLIWETIELLKEQKPRLLTFEEVKKHFHIPGELLSDIKKYVDFKNDIEPLYLECNIEDEWVVHWRTYDIIIPYLDTWEKDYGKTWRCWTKKPTEEQKRAVKWDG